VQAEFLDPSSLVLRPTHPPVQWILTTHPLVVLYLCLPSVSAWHVMGQLYLRLLKFEGCQYRLFQFWNSCVNINFIVLQLIALLTLGYQFPHLQLDSFVKPLVPPGSRAEPHEVLSAHDTGNSSRYPMPYRAVLLMAEMGM